MRVCKRKSCMLNSEVAIIYIFSLSADILKTATMVNEKITLTESVRLKVHCDSGCLVQNKSL